jgi:SAM-dependent methyltransferase
MGPEETKAVLDHFARPERVGEYLDAPEPMNEARRDLVRRLVLANVPPKSPVLEIGCGIGTLTADLVASGMICTAIDLSPEMVRVARQTLGGNAEVQQADVFDYAPRGTFAAVVANGVAPYYRDQQRFLHLLAALAGPKGIVVVGHRNALFNLFALNRGTIDFIANDLLPDLAPDLRQRVVDELSAAIPGLQQPLRGGSSAGIYRSAENPLTIAESYRAAGLAVREIRYCFIHGAPPRLPAAGAMPSVGELQHIYEQRWQGMFLGSQFVVLAECR